jgi:hypothetical protein
MRMDPSDLLELRALIPAKMNNLQKEGRTIPLMISEGPDVTDIDNNGSVEVVDVSYYAVPTSSTTINNPENWKPENYNKNYWNKIFGTHANKTQKFSNNISGVGADGTDSNKATFLPIKFTFKVTSSNEVDPTTGQTKVVNRGEFTGLPKYENINGTLTITGIHPGIIPIMTIPQRPTSIIQYREDGTLYTDPNAGGGDYQTGKPGGKFSPVYFNTLPQWPLQ